MKTSNNILYVIAVLLSAFLLWLWYYLGFNEVDAPLDLVISIIWWVVIVGTVAGIIKFEKTRKEKIRTTYVGAGFVFNSEAGRVAIQDSALNTIENVLKELRYDFTRVDVDDATKAAIKAVVRTKIYEAPQAQEDQEPQEPTWEGEYVPAIKGAQPVPFSSKEQLAALLAAL